MDETQGMTHANSTRFGYDQPCIPARENAQIISEVLSRSYHENTSLELRLMNQERLRHLAQNYKHEVTIFSAHDAIEYLSLRESGDTYLKSSNVFPLDSFDDEASLGLS